MIKAMTRDKRVMVEMIDTLVPACLQLPFLQADYSAYF